jgi:hypothetical protein
MSYPLPHPSTRHDADTRFPPGRGTLARVEVMTLAQDLSVIDRIEAALGASRLPHRTGGFLAWLTGR